MTEEIIIDGVNVAECEYMLNNKIKGKQHCPAKAMPYAKETSCICRKFIDTPYNFCKHNPNCHYKQLKQAENTVNECHKYLAELEDKIERLEQENKELKARIKHQCYRCRIGDTTEDKLRSALEEIREIAEKSIKISYNLEVNSMLYDIKRKINEVLNPS